MCFFKERMLFRKEVVNIYTKQKRLRLSLIWRYP